MKLFIFTVLTLAVVLLFHNLRRRSIGRISSYWNLTELIDDVLIGGKSDIAHVYRIERHYDPNYFPAPYAKLDRTLNRLKEKDVRITFYSLRRKIPLDRMEGEGLSRKVLEHLARNTLALNYDLYMVLSIKRPLRILSFTSSAVRRSVEKHLRRAREALAEESKRFEFLKMRKLKRPEIERFIAELLGTIPVDTSHYNPFSGKPISSFFMNSDVIVEKGAVELHNQKVAVITACDFDPATASDTWKKAVSLFEEDFDACFSFERMPIAKQRRHMSLRANIYSSIRMGLKGIRRVEAEEQQSNIEEAVRQIHRHSDALFTTNIFFTVRAPSNDELSVKANMLLNVLRSVGVDCFLETKRTAKVFLETLPLIRPQQSRNMFLLTRKLVDMLPFHLTTSTFKPFSQCYFVDRAKRLQSFDLFLSQRASQSAVISGKTGEGKSFLTNYLLLTFINQNSNGHVYIIDVGGSYRRLVETVGGGYYPLRVDAGINIDPFRRYRGTSTISKHQMLFCASFLNLMSRGKVSYDALYEDIDRYFKSLNNEDSSLRDYLENAKIDVSAIRQIYARMREFFEEKRALDFSKNVVCIDFDRSKIDPLWRELTSFYIINHIWDEIENLPLEVRKMVIMDECWKYLSSDETTTRFINESYREVRKLNGSIVTVFQQLGDVAMEKTNLAILNNSALKFLLKQDVDEDNFRLASIDSEIFRSADIDSEHRVYSEMLLKDESSYNILRLFVPKDFYFMATTDPEDIQRMGQEAKRPLPQEPKHEASEPAPSNGGGRKPAPGEPFREDSWKDELLHTAGFSENKPSDAIVIEVKEK